jgi:hypothetical protein
MNDYISKLVDAERIPAARKPRALFVRRGWDGCEPVAATAAGDDGVQAGEPAPTSLPCGRCAGCKGELPAGTAKRLSGVGLDKVKCIWTCKVGPLPGGGEQCHWCRTNGWPHKCSGCARRKELISGASALELPSAEAAAAPAADEVEAKGALQLSDLPASAPERCILEDSDLAVVYVTSSSLTAETQAGRLLRLAFVRRGMRLVAIDECHTVCEQSMAGYAPSVAAVGSVLDGLDERCALAWTDERQRWARPQRVALTSTLPPAIREVYYYW